MQPFRCFEHDLPKGPRWEYRCDKPLPNGTVHLHGICELREPFVLEYEYDLDTVVKFSCSARPSVHVRVPLCFFIGYPGAVETVLFMIIKGR